MDVHTGMSEILVNGMSSAALHTGDTPVVSIILEQR